MLQTIKQFFAGLFFLLLACPSFGQTALLDVQAKLAAYTKQQLPEKIFLHTDKTFYTAGEILWFKIYVVDGVAHQPLSESKVAYVELLDKTNAPVLRAKIALGQKGGNGSFQLPFHLPTGSYTIRGYTSWMKNLGAAHFFEERLTVVNTLKSPEMVGKKQTPSHVLQLFPEGGNLVQGHSSKIAFHLTDNTGKGVDGQGYLLTEKNDTLSSFRPYKFGMGHFVLTPQNGTRYKVIFTLTDGKTVSAPGPQSYEQGYTMRVEETSNHQLKITVQASNQPDLREIYLLAQTRQVVKAAQKQVISNGSAVFVVDKNSLGDGVSQLTIFDSEKKPVCERLFFMQPRSKNKVSLRVSKDQYASRERVDLSLPSLPNGKQTMSLSVYQLDELQSPQSTNIDHYLWLTSELTGMIEQPAYYFSAPDTEVQQATDYLMLTHGWRRFQWERALGQLPTFSFPREQFSQLVTGRVIDTRTNTAAKGVQAFLSIPRSPQKLFSAISDYNGFVQFEVQGYFGQGEIIVQTNSQKDSFYKVEIFNPFAESLPVLPPAEIDLAPSQESSLITRSIGMQTQHLYTADSLVQFLRPHLKDSFPFYGQPLYSYQLDDYVRFNTMEEVLREYVREINVGVRGGGSSLRFKLFNETDRVLYSDDVLLMVDGIPYFNANNTFEIDPLKIRKLDVINRHYVLGNFLFYGLVNFTSYSGNHEGIKLDPKAVSLDYEGLQLQREFYSPDYSSIQDRTNRIPDFRNTLYWSPDISTQNLHFFTSDTKGRYLISLQGIDEDGQPISTSSVIEVK